MPILRRSLLALAAASPLAALAPRARAAEPDPMGPRTLGSPDAKIKVMEFFSLTCTHCAAFSRETMPQVRKELIEPGKLQMIYRDFPLDQVALLAAMIARMLPPERYEPFVSTLFATQDRWAFNRANDPKEELRKMALLAGMSAETFEATIKNEKLRAAIMAEEQRAEKEYHIDSTPTFVCDGRTHAGEMNYAAFVKFINGAG